MLEGIAFHWYSGDHFEALDICTKAFPGMVMMQSECCALHAPGSAGLLSALMGGGPSAAEVEYNDAIDYAHDLIGDINNGMNRWIDWNLCVDENGGPRHVSMGFGAPVYANEDGSFRNLLTFDYIGHFSKYIFPGAKRIGFSDDRKDWLFSVSSFH